MPDFSAITRAMEGHNRARIYTGVAALVLIVGGVVGYVLLQPMKAPKQTVAEVPLPVPDSYAKVHIQAKAAIVVDLTNGTTLYERNAQSQLPLASLTKLLTTYAAANTFATSSTIQITPDALAAEGDSGLSEGEQFTFEELAQFALVASSNDAAAAIAQATALARSQNTRSALQAAALDAELTQTYALNGTGLDENDSVAGAYGSAQDIAKLSGKLLAKAPYIAHATVAPTVTITSKSGAVHQLPNTDIALHEYPNVLLSKTGYTDLAGGNLAIVFDVGLNHPVAVVVLGSTRDERFSDVATLVRATLAHFAGIPSS